MGIDINKLWDEKERRKRRPGLTERQLNQWEESRGVVLPKMLRAALSRQNGGLIRYNDVRVRPLERFYTPDAEFWEWALYSKKLFRDKAMVFHFADGACEQMLLLNFNERGPRGQPTVWYYFSDPGDVRRDSNNLESFFSWLLTVKSKPQVDWSETTQLDPVLHQETIVEDHRRSTYVLGRRRGRLLLFRDEMAPGSERRLTRTSIPEPLSQDWASIDNLDPMRPGRPFELHLQPVNARGMHEVESTRKADGKWKNSTLRGGPWVPVESFSKAKLSTLRRRLLGKRGAAKAVRDERETRRILADPEAAVAKLLSESISELQSVMDDMERKDSSATRRTRKN